MFVSHNTTQVRRLCTRAIVLEEGRLAFRRRGRRSRALPQVRRGPRRRRGRRRRRAVVHTVVVLRSHATTVRDGCDPRDTVPSASTHLLEGPPCAAHRPTSPSAPCSRSPPCWRRCPPPPPLRPPGRASRCRRPPAPGPPPSPPPPSPPLLSPPDRSRPPSARSASAAVAAGVGAARLPSGTVALSRAVPASGYATVGAVWTRGSRGGRAAAVGAYRAPTAGGPAGSRCTPTPSTVPTPARTRHAAPDPAPTPTSSVPSTTSSCGCRHPPGEPRAG